MERGIPQSPCAFTACAREIDIRLLFFTHIYKLPPLLPFIELIVTCLLIADHSGRAV
jgi:hypothetical protein